VTINGKKMGMPFSCSLTLTVGLTGEFQARILAAGEEGGGGAEGEGEGSGPSITISFTKEPVMQVQTSGTQVKQKHRVVSPPPTLTMPNPPSFTCHSTFQIAQLQLHISIVCLLLHQTNADDSDTLQGPKPHRRPTKHGNPRLFES
jgi:hypothetical protein